MPVEFSGAAYRLGHSMVRERYQHNRIFGRRRRPRHALPLHRQVRRHRRPARGDDDRRPLGRAMQRLPSNWAIDWRRFYEVVTPQPAGVGLNPSRAGSTRSSCRRCTRCRARRTAARCSPSATSRRGVRSGCPPGRTSRRSWGSQPLDRRRARHRHRRRPDGERRGRRTACTERRRSGTTSSRRPQLTHEGQRLGPGRLAPSSPRPSSASSTATTRASSGGARLDARASLAQPGTFTMADLLNFVGDLNPIG